MLGRGFMDTIKIPGKKTKMLAHRGVSKLERENTCPAAPAMMLSLHGKLLITVLIF